MSLTDLRFPLERLTWEQFHMDLSRNAGYALGILIMVLLERMDVGLSSKTKFSFEMGVLSLEVDVYQDGFKMF